MTVRPLAAGAAEESSVVLTRGAYRFHAGIAYRHQAGEMKILHLAGHNRVQSAPLSAVWAQVVPHMDPIELQIVAANCATLAKVHPVVPYGLACRGKFNEDGTYAPGQAGEGLTCASFVQKVFEWSRTPLVDVSTWTARADDRAAQEALVDYLRQTAADPEHIELVRRDIGCIRVRPEEVGAATAVGTRPMAFLVAEGEGSAIGETAEALRLW